MLSYRKWWPTTWWLRLSFLCVVTLLLMTISGCANLPATQPVAVRLPSDCDRLARPVPYPAVVKDEDLGVRSAKYAAALRQANGRLYSVRLCERNVRAKFAGSR